MRSELIKIATFYPFLKKNSGFWSENNYEF